MPENRKVVSWELVSEGAIVKLIFEGGLSFGISFVEFRENTRDIMNSSLEEIYQKYLVDKGTVLGVPVVPVEVGKRAYIYDFVKDSVFKTSKVKSFTLYSNDIVSVNTQYSKYIVATFCNKITVPEHFIESVQTHIKADAEK